MKQELPDIALEELIARTNLSEVWRGRRLPNGAEVAVKFALTPGGEEALLHEAETVASLLSSGVAGIVPVQHAASPTPHLVLPWKGRRTFRQVLDAISGGDDRSRAARILCEVAGTVAHVQQLGTMHGDLKPENILVDDDGRPWLTDFGMARAIRTARLDTEVGRSMDRTADAWGGTLHYLPPEGLQGEHPAPAWDVYSLGVMLHEVLLGRRPDRAATPESLRALLPHAVVDLLLKALAHTPGDRFPSVPALAAFLRPLQTELTVTGPRRLARRAARYALTAFAAFFVAYRYVSVLALLAGYAALAWAAVAIKGDIALGFVPALLLHMVVRWEGPETREEAILRASGRVRDPR